MNRSCNLPEEILCGCCDGLHQETPLQIFNRPALKALSYRTGTYSTFLESMLAALSDPGYSNLASLRTREESDFTIALLDAWSVSLDILSFYQERFANEAFLGTSVDERSVFELARLVGYTPSPGVASSAVLAFTLYDAPGSPDSVVIPAGTRVKSIPGPGEKPQVFETDSDLTAMIARNSLPAQTRSAWELRPGDISTWVGGTANNINVGDALLFIATSETGQPSPAGPADLRVVSRLSIDAVSGNTQVWWNTGLSTVISEPTGDVALYILRKKAALFGAAAINPFLLPADTLAKLPGAPSASVTASRSTLTLHSLMLGGTLAPTKAELYRFDLPTDWIFQSFGPGIVNLDALVTGLLPAGSAPAQLQWLVLADASNNAAAFQITAADESNPNLYALSAKTSRLTLSSTFAILSGSPGESLESALGTFIAHTRETSAYIGSQLLAPVSLPLTQWSGALPFSLAEGMIVPVQGSSIAVIGGQTISAKQPIGVSGKRVRLQVSSGAFAMFAPSDTSTALPVTDRQIFLVDAFPPALDETGLLNWNVTTLTSVAGILTLEADNLTLLPADAKDAAVGESALVSTIAIDGETTTLGLQSSLTRIYDADTVRVNANAVNSTHGETVHELLGSGDAKNSALEFSLKQSPLTYITAGNATGSQSTLQVWVNNLQWHEIGNLLSAEPADRVFTTRATRDGGRIVQFGNGQEGARTPTGQMNIRAVYRKGMGRAGMVSANQLSQPLDRPQGVKLVTNPGPASGAADPASAADARQSAPLPTLTLGRIVSLQDYQTFATNFAGIARALATWTWFGTRRGVFLTIAGAGGAVLAQDDPVVLKLIAAIQQASNPFIPFRVASFIPVEFRIGAAVKVDSYSYDTGQVLAQVWSNLQAKFSFAHRDLAQSVVASEITQIIQNTPGVMASRLSTLQVAGSGCSGAASILCASGPLPPQGAQMLLLDPGSQALIGGWS